MTKPKTKRNERIKHLRFVEHWVLQDIADFYGISRQRVGKILGRTGGLRQIRARQREDK